MFRAMLLVGMVLTFMFPVRSDMDIRQVIISCTFLICLSILELKRPEK